MHFRTLQRTQPRAPADRRARRQRVSDRTGRNSRVSESVAGSGENWERQVLERLVRSVLDEQRRARKWSIFFKILLFIYLFALLFMALGWIGGKDKGLTGKHTALVELNGVISHDSPASAERI